MGVGPLIGFLILMALMIIGSVSLWYFARKKKSKVGILISSSLLLVFLAILFMNKIDQLTHSKSDVCEDLKFAQIILHDDFKIIENKVYGMPERFQETRIEISTSDLQILLKEIKSDPNYHQSEQEQILRSEMYSNPKKNSIVTANYAYRDNIIRESYFKKDEYVPSLFIVRLKENQNVLEYETIED